MPKGMQIEKLYVENFRNLKTQELKFSEGINLIIGANAQGKTNLLEAIYLLAYGKSFRHAKDEELLNLSLPLPKTGILEAKYLDDNNLTFQVKLVISLTEKGKEKRAFFQGKRLDAISDLQGKLLVVEFLPTDIYLASDEPAERRKFIDDILSTVNPEYKSSLKSYYQVIREKNRLLETINKGEGAKDLLEAYNYKVLELGALITYERLKLMITLKRYVNLILKRYSFLDDVELLYYWTCTDKLVSPEEYYDKGEIKEALRKALMEKAEMEIARGKSLIGPHRDSPEFTIRGTKVKYILSQSQSNILSLALKIAKAGIIKRHFNRNPIMILDEPFAYIDERNTEITLKILSKLDQIFIASNRWEMPSAKKYLVLSGEIKSKREGK